MNSHIASRADAALLVASLLLGGVLLGGVVDVLRQPPVAASAGPLPSSTEPLPSVGATVPSHDVVGEDFASLPRYPGSARSAYALSSDAGYQLAAAEYLAAATVADVRTFYQGVIADHAWERADITYADGEWAYVLVKGEEEALVEIELRDGLVEIDLQMSVPIDQATPVTPAPVPPVPAPAEAPPATQPPPPAAPDPPIDDGGDDDDEESIGDDDGAEADD